MMIIHLIVECERAGEVDGGGLQKRVLLTRSIDRSSRLRIQ